MAAAQCWRVRAGEVGYPDCLTDLGDLAPEEIFGLGDPGVLADVDPDRTVTMVGSRRSRAYGRGVARGLGFGAAAAGLLVVSGMALGCDSAAHEGALDANGPTLAVLGGPADVTYPASKEPLYRRIIASGGTIISERRPGTEHHSPATFLPATGSWPRSPAPS